MAELSEWLERLQQSTGAAFADIGAYLPSLAGALLLMVLGWVAARLLRAAFVGAGASINGLLRTLTRPAFARAPRLSPTLVALIGNVLFWVVILLFAAISARVARLDAFSSWLDRVVSYLPTLVAGGFIALAGYLVSTLVRDVVSAAVASAGSAQKDLFGFAAQVAVFVTAVVIGLDQIGLDVTFLIILLAVVVGGGLLSMALAFGFGARDFVGNLIAAHHMQRTLEPGEHARIGDMEGRVLEITSTSVVLMTEHGRLLVPARLFQQQTALILGGGEDE